MNLLHAQLWWSIHKQIIMSGITDHFMCYEAKWEPRRMFQPSANIMSLWFNLATRVVIRRTMTKKGHIVDFIACCITINVINNRTSNFYHRMFISLFGGKFCLHVTKRCNITTIDSGIVEQMGIDLKQRIDWKWKITIAETGKSGN